MTDVADIVAFLASNDARWITGQLIDGGGGSGFDDLQRVGTRFAVATSAGYVPATAMAKWRRSDGDIATHDARKRQRLADEETSDRTRQPCGRHADDP